jgi:hypothetical protein
MSLMRINEFVQKAYSILYCYRGFILQIKPSRAIDFIAVALLILFSYRLLLHFDTTWDVLAYHLSFVAQRGSLPNADSFVMSFGNYQRYLGFPSLIDYVRAVLWRVTGIPQGINLIIPLAIGCLAVYVHLFFRVSFTWVLLIFVGFPALHTALRSPYVDLWTNSFFSLFLLSAYHTLFMQTRRTLHATIAIFAILIAVNSKSQFYLIGAIGFIFFVAGILYEYIFDRHQDNEERITVRTILFLVIIVGPIIFISPIINTILFGNPIYPVAISIGGIRLNGRETSEAWAAYSPLDLRQLPQWARWTLSQLEYRALSMRPGGYSLGQGNVEAGTESDRMGGSLLILLVIASSAFVLAVLRLPRNRRAIIISIATMGILTITVATIPGSHDLRYFSFLEMVLLIASLAALERLQANGDLKAEGMLYIVRVALLGSSLFVSFITGFSYIYPSEIDAAGAIRAFGVHDELTSALRSSRVLCYARPLPYAILYSKLLNPDIPEGYKVISVGSVSECPESAFVFR